MLIKIIGIEYPIFHGDSNIVRAGLIQIHLFKLHSRRSVIQARMSK